jgi:hypothetical protein
VVEVMSSKSDLALHMRWLSPRTAPLSPLMQWRRAETGWSAAVLETRYGCSTGVESENDGVVNCSYLKVGYSNRPGELGLVAHKAVIRHYIA